MYGKSKYFSGSNGRSLLENKSIENPIAKPDGKVPCKCSGLKGKSCPSRSSEINGALKMCKKLTLCRKYPTKVVVPSLHSYPLHLMKITKNMIFLPKGTIPFMSWVTIN